MPSYSRTKGAVVASSGFYVGSKGSETAVISSAGFVSGQKAMIDADFSSSSAAQTIYCIAPFAGNITAVYVCNDTASRSAAFTVAHGSAGSTAASITTSTAAQVAGYVESMTLGTVAVTAGESLSVTRAAQGTAGASAVTIVITRTS